MDKRSLYIKEAVAYERSDNIYFTEKKKIRCNGQAVREVVLMRGSNTSILLKNRHLVSWTSDLKMSFLLKERNLVS